VSESSGVVINRSLEIKDPSTGEKVDPKSENPREETVVDPERKGEGQAAG
jgi:hypothetical protein